jgi:hypothetical protein
VYQPEGLAAKLKDASAFLGDSDVGENLAALLASDTGHRTSISVSQGLETAQQDSVGRYGPLPRTSCSSSDVSKSPCSSAQVALQAPVLRPGTPGDVHVAALLASASPVSSSVFTGPCPSVLVSQSLSKPHCSVMHTAAHALAPIMEPSEKLLAGVGSPDFNVLELDSATQVHSVQIDSQNGLPAYVKACWSAAW